MTENLRDLFVVERAGEEEAGTRKVFLVDNSGTRRLLVTAICVEACNCRASFVLGKDVC